MKFESGDLVKWIEEYADGGIVKDAGIGIIVGSQQYKYKNHAYNTYEIYRNKHSDKMFFEERNVTKLKGE